jgi:bifunctional DNA-binding transcriptional regulator/antitoxin component of YhaV-PrlF toxin-antitoxin module
MPEYKFRRKVQEQSGSYFVTIPKPYIEAHGVRQGDVVIVAFDSYPGLRVLPQMVSPPEGHTVHSMEHSDLSMSQQVSPPEKPRTTSRDQRGKKRRTE